MTKIPRPATVTTSVPVLSAEQLTAILATCQGRGRAYFKVRGQRAHATQPALFVSRSGRRLMPSGVGQLIDRIGKVAGVDGLHPHMFRHSWTHYLLESEMKEHDICQMAGWSTTKQLSRSGASRAQDRAITAGLRNSVADRMRR